MNFLKLVSVSMLSLGLSLAASAKEFRIPLSADGENGDGNYTSLVVNKGFEDSIVYELVPANADVSFALKSKRCPDVARVDGSVLSRNLEIDHENRRPGTETVKLLVRKLDCFAP